MNEIPNLTLITFLPLIGVAILLLLRDTEYIINQLSRFIALTISGITFFASLPLLLYFDAKNTDFQFEEKYIWFEKIGISYHMGIDGISLFFIMLATFITPICILASFNAITTRVREYMIAFLVLETCMIGVFSALDSVLFYIFFESVLIPLFLIIGIWGGEKRVYAAFKFFLYTLLGSVLMLIAIITMIRISGTADIPVLMGYKFTPELQTWLWLAFFASFAIKMPMWPFHTWSPDAYGQAPTSGSAIMAGVLFGLGGYGFLRFSLPMFPDATVLFAPYIFGLSVIAIIYASLIAIVQTDIKRMIAYASVAHMGFVTIGLFTLNLHGINGAIFQMISHGLIGAGLFLTVGIIADRLKTTDINRFGNLSKNMPVYSCLFVIFMLGAIGLPGTSGFVGEFLVLLGIYKINTFVAVLAGSGVVFGVVYMLILTKKIIFGAKENTDAGAMIDINLQEKIYLIPLAALVLFLGFHPNYILEKVNPSVEDLIKVYAPPTPVVEKQITEKPVIDAKDLPVPPNTTPKSKEKK